MPMTKFTIEMDEHDFDKLASDINPWRAGRDRWSTQHDGERFRNMPRSEAVSYDWLAAYWVGREYTTAILARSFLTAIGEKSQLLSDEGHGELVLVTNFLSPDARKRLKDFGVSAE